MARKMSDETTIEKTQLDTERSRSMPDGWEMKKLNDLGEVQTGTTPSTLNKEYYGDFIPFVKPPHFNLNGTIEFNDLGLSEMGLAKGRLIKGNSILMVCIGASIGKTGITTIPISCNQQINAFTPNENCSPKFYYHLLSSDYFFKKVIKGSSQATLPMINKTKWQNIQVPLPPLPQQKQIVVTLDKAFAAIDTAKANAEQNLQNAKELFESISLQKFTVGINIKKWELEKIEKYSQVVVGYVGPISKEYTNDENDVLLLSTKNISDEGISLKKLTRINHTFHNKQKKSQLFPGDILVARHGKSGQSAVIPDSMKVAHALNVIIIKKSETILSEYIAFLLNSGVLSKIQDSKGGSVQEIINTSVIKNLIIPVPSLLNQGKIIEELNNVSKQAKKLESIYTQKIADLEEMKKSILQKAFSGELS
jgi:type I restriction enzyme S subunit